MVSVFLLLGFVILMWVVSSFSEEAKKEEGAILALPRKILLFIKKRILVCLANRFKKTEERITEILSRILEGILGALIWGFLIYWLFHWITTSALKDVLELIDKIYIRLSPYSLTIDKLQPLASLLWNIVNILFCGLLVIIFVSYLFSKLEEFCEKSRYGDFTKTYLRGLKVIGHFALLLLPVILWIFAWILGDAIDSIFFTQTSYSEYSKNYYTYHTNKIMWWVGFGSIPFLFALYFPIVKGVKRCLAESRGKRILIDEIEDLKKQNKALKDEVDIRRKYS